MKKSIYISFITIAILLFGVASTFAANNQNCEVLSGYEKYTCQTKNHCKDYKPKHISFQAKEYEENTTDEDDIFIKAKNLYRENQNGIYSCSIIKIQANSLKLIKEKLIKIDKSGNLSSTLKKKIDLKINKIKALSKQKKCKNTDKKTIYSKKDVLIESTYQLCKYSFYLEYSKQHYKNINNTLQINKDDVHTKTYAIDYIVQKQREIQSNIDQEKNHTYKIFHLAFQSYIDYESNLPVHLLFELIKQDFIVYRQKLYQTLSPLNQVVYKISNAMSIH